MKSMLFPFNQHSIVLKLLLAFLLVVLPLYALSISITMYSSNKMQAEVERANESKLHFYYDHLEFELQRINRLVTEYSIDDTLSFFPTRLPIMSRYEVDNNLNHIYTKLKQISETSSYIRDVVYYVPQINKRVSVQDGIRNASQEDWQKLAATMGNLSGTVSLYENQLYVLRSNPFNLDQDVAPNFLLGIELSTTELEQRLRQFSLSGESDITLEFGSNHEYIVSTSQPSLKLDSNKQWEKENEVLQSRRYQQQDSFFYSLYNSNNNFTLTVQIPNHVLLQPIQVFSKLMWMLTLLAVVIVLLFSLWSYRMIHRPMAVLIRGFKRAEQGQTGLYITHSRKDEFGFIYTRFNNMLRRLHTLIEENYVQRIRTGEAELKHLQSQITPHFLYNSLFSIKQMAQVENVELIEEFTDYLGQYFRYMTRNFDQEVTLKEELDHALVYLAIQEIRFGSKFRSEIEDLDRDCHSIQVPRVLLQPLVENVFEHGLKQKSSGGLLVIRYIKEQHALTIIVEDNGESLDDNQLLQLQQQFSNMELTKGETTGLFNVAHRLRIKFGFPYGVQVERSLLGGLCIKINIPRNEDLMYAQNDDN